MGTMFFPDDFPKPKRSGYKPTATIQRIWVEEITFRGESGLMIHIKFMMTNAKGIEDLVGVYFYRMDGVPLIDRNGSYRNSIGQVAHYAKYDASGYVNPYWEDFRLFIPKRELHLSKAGTIACRVFIWHREKELAASDFHHFYVRG